MFGGEIQTEQKKYRICIRVKVDDNNLIKNRSSLSCGKGATESEDRGKIDRVPGSLKIDRVHPSHEVQTLPGN